jgi:hypothetical protein
VAIESGAKPSIASQKHDGNDDQNLSPQDLGRGHLISSVFGTSPQDHRAALGKPQNALSEGFRRLARKYRVPKWRGSNSQTSLAAKIPVDASAALRNP